MLHNTLPSASHWVTFGIPALALVVSLLGCLGYARAVQTTYRADSRTILLRALAWVAAWAALAGITASSGVLSRMDLRPPPFAMLFIIVLSLGLVLGLGRVGRQLSNLPVAA